MLKTNLGEVGRKLEDAVNHQGTVVDHRKSQKIFIIIIPWLPCGNSPQPTLQELKRRLPSNLRIGFQLG